MNDPFFRSYVNEQPLRPARPVSLHQTHRKSSPKVVSVPVHFVSSAQSPSKDSAALKIQTVLRGFLVRKSVKKIASIKNEISEIQMRVNDIAVVELIRRDAKERLRVNETLMSLLFKLDSIRGVDCGVRDFRKAVIKRAIALQEKVDSIVAADYETLDAPITDSGEIASEEHVLESSDPRDEVADGENVDNSNPVEAVDDCGLEKSQEIAPIEDLAEIERDNHSLEVRKESGGRDDNKRNGELLEKYMVDNEKMMTLVTQISERNEMQSRMLNSLSQRVEQLEKSLTCDKRKRKKRHPAS